MNSLSLTFLIRNRGSDVQAELSPVSPSSLFPKQNLTWLSYIFHLSPLELVFLEGGVGGEDEECN